MTSAMALFFVVLGYVVLLPSGIFDDNEFMPTPWEEWGIPGDPPAERPLISEWFDQSPTWQEALRLREVSGVAEQQRSLQLANWHGKVSNLDTVKDAIALIQARAEAGIELTRVASDYSLRSLSKPLSDGLSESVVSPILWITGAFVALCQTPQVEVHTGRDVNEWIDYFGEFAASMMPLGDSCFEGSTQMELSSHRFIETTLDLLRRGIICDSCSLARTRRSLALVRDRDHEIIGRAAYAEAHRTQAKLDRYVGPGDVWRNSGKVVRAFQLEFHFQSMYELDLMACDQGWSALFDFFDWRDGKLANWWVAARIQREKTKALIDERYRDQVNLLQMPPIKQLCIHGQIHNGWREFLDPQPNAIGEMFFWGSVGVGMQRRKKLGTLTAATMVETTLAIAQWREAGGGPGLPATLDELVPEFLDGLPVDAFNGEPLGYDAARGLLWSVGVDGVDSGGVREEPFLGLIDELGLGFSSTLDLWHVFQIEPDGEGGDAE